ncbi:M23 family metallopeptidase [uncultured Methanocorpusculum sp.]|nr:M23 family metallopeptidase [uncultured Methanocorpusculum sp.]
MSKYHLILIAVILTAVLLSAGCVHLPQESGQFEVNLSVPVAPIPVSSVDGKNLAYEFELSPAGNLTFTPEKLEVLDAETGKVLWSAEGDVLAALYHPASNPLPTALELQNGTSKLSLPRISIWFTVDENEIPNQLTHKLTLNYTGYDPVIITGGKVTVQKDLEPVIIGSPLRGSGWTAIETTNAFTHHFLAEITLDSVTRVPQKYAQDWIFIDPDTGDAVIGNGKLAKDYLGYGKEIYSVSNGTVVDLKDGLPDEEYAYAARSTTVETAAGNYVIIDMGNEKYACYAHMIPGSITVSLGDVVSEGQVIGLVGNSGNSDIPHLHFQVVTGKASFLGAEGYPYEYRSFEVIGKINATAVEVMMAESGYTVTQMWENIGTCFVKYQTPVARQNELPGNWDVLMLP